jgi:hypothetical protein
MDTAKAEMVMGRRSNPQSGTKTTPFTLMSDSNETARLASAKSGREKRSQVETLFTAPGDLAPTRDIWELNDQTKNKE